MLVTGKPRLYVVACLALVAFLALLTLSYNPSLPENSAQTLRNWAKTSTDHAPSWSNYGQTPPSSQDTLSYKNEHDHTNAHDDLPSANPDPYAAIGGVISGVEKKPPASPPPHSSTKEPEPSDDQKNIDYVKDHMGVPLNPHNHDHKVEGIDQTDVTKHYNTLESKLTQDGKYFHLSFRIYDAFNPSIIPHPRKENTWIMVAQRLTLERGFPSGWSDEISCDIQFNTTANYNMTCMDIPVMLPVAATQAAADGCPGRLGTLHMNIGPHDARVFYGPRFPYIVYGSQSQYGCFGQWMHDFRMLYDWGQFRNYSDPYDKQTEVQKPGGNGGMEKNYFLFWDMEDNFYAHYDTAPHRSYAKLDPDGAAGPDIALQSRAKDEVCWAKHLALNPIPSDGASIHQATNSLSVTMCHRANSNCIPTEDNTYIIQIYQHKVGNGLMHARYEPYVMMFKRKAPFEMYAISSKPLWVSGRSSKNEMMYLTSMNWKVKDVNYSGFLDDTIFLAFGVEDKRTGAIDITAQELLGELMYC